jgi:hypothetical protein
MNKSVKKTNVIQYFWENRFPAYVGYHESRISTENQTNEKMSQKQEPLDFITFTAIFACIYPVI